MTRSLHARYSGSLDEVDDVMVGELAQWQWSDLGEMEQLVSTQIRRRGKRMRPLLGFAVCGHLGGRPELACAPLASVELYHLAALVLDDVQDNSDVRRGVGSVRASSSTSTAINVAALIRSLSYHPIHRSTGLSVSEKLGMHRELDEAATLLVMGQSIDIGWHEGWYSLDGSYPYAHMVRCKTGSLFGCAAAMGALAARADPETVTLARAFGSGLGELYQIVDDYLDAFGDASDLGRPVHEDLREGKMSAPVVTLLRVLDAAGSSDELSQVSGWLRQGGLEPDARDALLGLMGTAGIPQMLRDDVTERTDALRSMAGRLAPAGPPDLVELVELTAARIWRGAGNARDGNHAVVNQSP